MTDFSLINAALTRTGNDPITSLADPSAGAKIAAENYDELIKGMLGHPWKWAGKTQALNLLDGEPDPPWLFAYQRPTDVLELRTVMVGGWPIPYEVQSDKILCNFGEDSVVISKYTWRPPESDWPVWFREAVITALEPLFLRGIGERFDEATTREKVAVRALAIAKNRDAQQQTARAPETSPTLNARRGSPATSRWPGP